jgi:divalent metal cation (Fe/Co/Zn/Cd) transporter
LVILVASVVVMPLLARAKRRVAMQLGGDPLILADAAETRICVLLSISTLIGLGLFALTGWAWLDPVAGFVIAIFALYEGREAWEGELVERDGGDED